MRKLSFIMILVFCATLSFAQKAKVGTASSYMTAGKLDQAKKAIDEAMKNEKCLLFTKGYFVKGQIYQALFESPVAQYKNLSKGALDTALVAYKKVIELDEKNKFTKKLETQYANLIIDFTNEAVGCYNKQDFKGALVAFEKVLMLENSDIMTAEKPAKVDTLVIYNAAVSAYRGGNLAAAEKYYKRSLELNYEADKTYAMLANILKEQGKKEESIEFLKKGIKLFPESSQLLVEMINYYLQSGTPEKADSYLETAIKQDPKNASFYRVKGSLYEKTNQFEKAEEMYHKTLELDPKDFVAQYQLGIIQLNRVIDFHKKVINIEDMKEYDKEMVKVYDRYEACIPYFVKALQLQPNEKNTVTTLKELYFKLRNVKKQYQPKYEQMKKLLDTL